MTEATPTPDAVTQADRDAAASISVLSDHADMLRNGEYDDHPTVQAFARHRQQSASPSGLVEAAAAIQGIAGRAWELMGEFNISAPTELRTLAEGTHSALAALSAPAPDGEGEALSHEERVEYEQRILALKMDIERMKKGEQPIYADLTRNRTHGHLSSGR